MNIQPLLDALDIQEKPPSRGGVPAGEPFAG